MTKKEATYPALSAYSNIFGIPSLYPFSQSDVEPAYKVASLFWEEANVAEKKHIPKYIRTLFSLWKMERGLSHELEINQTNPAKSGLSKIFFPSISEEERLKKIKGLKPWECSPSWVQPDPISFLFYLWVNEHWTLSFHDFLIGLSWLIIKYSQDNNLHFRAPIIVKGLWLSEIRLSVAEESGKELFYNNKKLKEKLKSDFKFNKEYKVKKDFQIQQIHRHADSLLSKNMPVSAIAKNIELSGQHINKRSHKEDSSPPEPLSYRTILRHLKSHPSGNW